jgi:lysine-N-methylase
MKIIRPAYYDQFRCLAGECPDSCCQEWEVEVDNRSAERYLKMNGDLGERLKEHLYQEDGNWFLRIVDGRCPMWQEDGLCRIQAAFGEEGLCQVCHDFPRLRHDYGDFVELGLELSCPEAARLILTTQSQPEMSCETGEVVEPEYDTDAMEILLRTRQVALELLKYGSVPEALTLLLLYGYRAQEELDGGSVAVCNPQKELAFARKLAQKGTVQELCSLYKGLEILTPRWVEMLRNPHPHNDWPEALRAMARYGVQRHWLQAVSDYDLACRVKMIVTGCILVRNLGGDVIATAQLWSKEIENSTENLEALLDAAYASPLITDAKLLGLLTTATAVPDDAEGEH